MQIFYGFQLVPGSDASLSFTLTLEECKAAAKELRDEQRALPDEDDIDEAMAVYECTFRFDKSALLDMLNSPDADYKLTLVSKKLVAVIVD